MGAAGLGLTAPMTVPLVTVPLAAPAVAAPRKKPEVQSIVADTARGRVRGVANEGIKTFKGIPYGAPTDGGNRFREPKQAVPWKGIRDALSYGPRCPQDSLPTPSPAAVWTDDSPMSEDCLYLNIWTPALRDHRKRPVMVWFHGGGFASGSGGSPVCDGTNLAKKGDVVVVSLNHRLNLFGHLFLARLGGTEFAESGNLGVLDLVAALRWIHTNIAEFGGDPASVTLFGQEGGGAKVSTLMAMPQTRGLFHRAIVQSGSQLDGLTADEAHANAVALLKAADVPATELTRLQRLPAEALLAAARKLARGPGPAIRFQPVVDGRFVPRPPWTPDGPATSAGVPMLIGTTKTETAGALGAADATNFSLDDAGLRRKLAGWVPPNDIDRVVAFYRRIMPDAAPSDLFFAIATARRVRQHAWLQAERKAAQNAGPVWLYELNWQAPVEDGKRPSSSGLEVPLVFDNVPRPEPAAGRGEAQRAIAEQMSSTWLAFARTGNPNNKTVPAWAPFRLPERMAMVFDTKSRAIGDFRGDERQLLAGLPVSRVVW